MSEPSKRFRSRTLGETLRSQGRKARWLAAQVKVSESSISRLISGKQTIGEGDAQKVALILGAPFFVLFESVEPDIMSVATVEVAA